MDTNITEIKPVIGQGITLATLGVILTTAFTGGFVHLLASWAFPEAQAPFVRCLLLAAVMSSTDSASVFNILRSKDLNLKHNLRPLLELESGSNDPYGPYVDHLIDPNHSIGRVQFRTGAAFHSSSNSVSEELPDIYWDACAVYTLNHFRTLNQSLPDCSSGPLYFSISFTEKLQGNGYLAVYIAGLVVGNRRSYTKEYYQFFDSTAWLFQIIMFLP